MPVPEKPYTRKEAYLNAAATGDTSGIPETPYTREEMYLDAIATGDSSGIPDTPYTREEMYLDAIAKNGGGGGGGGGGDYQKVLLAEFDNAVITLDEYGDGRVEISGDEPVSKYDAFSMVEISGDLNAIHRDVAVYFESDNASSFTTYIPFLIEKDGEIIASVGSYYNYNTEKYGVSIFGFYDPDGNPESLTLTAKIYEIVPVA